MDGDASVCSQEVSINDQELAFSCQDEDFETIEITYTELGDFQNSFPMEFDYAGPVRWVVYVNGREIEDYHLFDRTAVILQKNLPPGSTSG